MNKLVLDKAVSLSQTNWQDFSISVKILWQLDEVTCFLYHLQKSMASKDLNNESIIYLVFAIVFMYLTSSHDRNTDSLVHFKTLSALIAAMWWNVGFLRSCLWNALQSGESDNGLLFLIQSSCCYYKIPKLQVRLLTWQINFAGNLKSINTVFLKRCFRGLFLSHFLLSCNVSAHVQSDINFT